MNSSKTAILGLLLTAATAGLSGCGDNILTALNKIATGQVCQLSAGEIKALNQTAIDLGSKQTPPVSVPVLTDDQAQAVADFLKLNGLCTIQDLQDLPARIRSGETLQGVDALAAAFGNIDTSNVDPHALETILHSTLGIGGHA